MKKAKFIILTLFVVLSSTTLVACKETSPSINDMVSYVKTAWKVVDTTDNIKQVLELDDPFNKGIKFKSEIGGILTIDSMIRDMNAKNYSSAAKKGAEWLAPFVLKEIGYTWISSYVSLGFTVYNLGKIGFMAAQQTAFNAQVKYYLWYLDNGWTEEKVRTGTEVMELGWLQDPEEDATIRPASNSGFTIDDVFLVGNKFWEAKKSNQHRSEDETVIKESFINALNRLKAEKTQSQVTLTVYVYENTSSGPLIAGAQVSGRDGEGRSFSQTTNLNGYVTVTGVPGSWEFTVYKSTYDISSWSQNIITTDTMYICLIKSTPQGKIVFNSDLDGNNEIYVMNVDGSNLIRLTNEQGDNVEPSWSPDGQKITFNSTRDGNSEIYIMNADGSNQIRLTNNSGSDYSPSWSPDGSKIAFTSMRDNGNREIYTMDASGKNQTRITYNVGWDFVPQWSPDGSRIAFCSDRVPHSGNTEIYVMHADGSNQVRLTNSPMNDYTPTFSPDGTKILFCSYRDGNNEIYVMNNDGSNQVKLTNNSTNDGDPSFSPNGDRIAFISYRDGNYEIYVMNVDGNNQTNITKNSARDVNPKWLPLLD